MLFFIEVQNRDVVDYQFLLCSRQNGHPSEEVRQV